MKTMQFEVGADGVALITLNDPDKPMNVVTPEFAADLTAAIDQVATDPAIKGAVITSGKASFVAGADLKEIVRIAGSVAPQEGAAFSERVSIGVYRRIETCGKPVAAAVNGLALGGGLELALACHYRLLADDPKVIVGLPEVTLGLLPGWGGTQRLPRIIGIEPALGLMLAGKSVGPADALKLRIVDAVAPRDQLIARAREWILSSPDPVRAWDKKGATASGGLRDNEMTLRATLMSAQTDHNYPAPSAILDCVFEGALLPFDAALKLEAKYFGKLLADPVSRNIIRTNFINKGEAAKLVRRPRDVPKSQVKKLGVLGAGMMGSGIAHVSAMAGIDVVLLDTDVARAEKGKAYSVQLLQKGKRAQAQVDAVLARIKPTATHADLADCDLVIEAVFEDKAIKADVTRKTEAVIPPAAIFASNTSTLPITELASASQRPTQFIGLHFFSPVDRMPLVEVIVGKLTAPATLARALDYIGQLKMVPIVVNDGRGFYTSRVFGAYIHEGMRMLADGVAPALIENAAKFAGMAVGPLAVLDEVTLELPMEIAKQEHAALGDRYEAPCGYPVLRRMLEEFKRPGKRYGKGFYDYPDSGKKQLWPGLQQAFPPAAEQPSVEEVKQRLLYI
ncbi:MAG: 3-hydroxyacyl-CoA dehydrogenase NAD-binding domain-containing protein, partial [Steroidobacteraceae bacterium]